MGAFIMHKRKETKVICFDRRCNFDICILSDNKLHICSSDGKCSSSYENLKDVYQAIDSNNIVWEYQKIKQEIMKK